MVGKAFGMKVEMPIRHERFPNRNCAALSLCARQSIRNDLENPAEVVINVNCQIKGGGQEPTPSKFQLVRKTECTTKRWPTKTLRRQRIQAKPAAFYPRQACEDCVTSVRSVTPAASRHSGYHSWPKMVQAYAVPVPSMSICSMNQRCCN